MTFAMSDRRARENDFAKKYIFGHQAHSDIGGLLERIGRSLEGVSIDGSMGRQPFPAIGLTFKGNFFALARGMQFLTLRLPETDPQSVVAHGAFPEEEIGFAGWFNLTPYSSRISEKELRDLICEAKGQACYP